MGMRQATPMGLCRWWADWQENERGEKEVVMSDVISIGAARSAQSGRASDWSPRELLVELIRELDAGETTADHLIVAWRPLRKGGENENGHFLAAGPSALVNLGLLSATTFKMQD